MNEERILEISNEILKLSESRKTTMHYMYVNNVTYQKRENYSDLIVGKINTLVEELETLL